jgi:hypothetical protein
VHDNQPSYTCPLPPSLSNELYLIKKRVLVSRDPIFGYSKAVYCATIRHLDASPSGSTSGKSCLSPEISRQLLNMTRTFLHLPALHGPPCSSYLRHTSVRRLLDRRSLEESLRNKKSDRNSGHHGSHYCRPVQGYRLNHSRTSREKRKMDFATILPRPLPQYYSVLPLLFS